MHRFKAWTGPSNDLYTANDQKREENWLDETRAFKDWWNSNESPILITGGDLAAMPGCWGI